jgi:hypothetical protein
LAPSVNETTAPIDNDKAVKAIGHVLKSSFMYEVDLVLMIVYSKINLSDGFWRMVVAGNHFNFAYVLPGKGPV